MRLSQERRVRFCESRSAPRSAQTMAQASAKFLSSPTPSPPHPISQKAISTPPSPLSSMQTPLPERQLPSPLQLAERVVSDGARGSSLPPRSREEEAIGGLPLPSEGTRSDHQTTTSENHPKHTGSDDSKHTGENHAMQTLDNHPIHTRDYHQIHPMHSRDEDPLQTRENDTTNTAQSSPGMEGKSEGSLSTGCWKPSSSLQTRDDAEQSRYVTTKHEVVQGRVQPGFRIRSVGACSSCRASGKLKKRCCYCTSWNDVQCSTPQKFWDVGFTQ